jgi:hypothetical protein
MAKIQRRQFIRGAAAAAAAPVVASVVAEPAEADGGHSAGVEPTVKEPVTTNTPRGTERFFDPYYNVVRGRVPESYHPWVANRQDRILLYTRTGGPRHAHLGPALAAGLNPALTDAHVLQNSIIRWMGEVGIGVDWTEDVTQMPGIGSPYKAVVFGSTSRDTMWKHGTAVSPTAAVNTTTGAHLDAAKTALRQYMRAGGGFVGIHNAIGGTEYNWVYYEGLCGGTQYYDHGANQNGEWSCWPRTRPRRACRRGGRSRTSGTTGCRSRPGSSSCSPSIEIHPSPPSRMSTLGHGRFHPLTWCQYYDGVALVGHRARPRLAGVDRRLGFVGQEFFRAHIVNGILSAYGQLASSCT